MTETAAIAPVVTEHEWERFERAQGKRPATSTLVRYRTAHADPKCRKVKASEIVARDVAIDTREAGLPCSYCWPDVVPSVGDPAPPAGGAALSDKGPDVTEQPTAPAGGTAANEAPGPRPSHRENRYAGKCFACGSWVQERAGRLLRTRAGWEVQHLEGECQESAGQATNEADQGPVPRVAAGHYAVDTPRGLVFIRVDRPTEGKWAGRTFVKQIIGGHPAEPVRGSAGIALLVLVENDPAAAATRYGQEIGRCHRCNRVLTDPESRRLGIGPECRGKGAS